MSPVDGRVLGWHDAALPGEVWRALTGLRAAAPGWAALPPGERVTRLGRLRRALARRAADCAATLAWETGRPLVEGYGAEILPTLRALAWLERHASRVLQPEVLGRWPRRRSLAGEPHGVVGVLTPWNFPLYLSVTALAWALAAGNTALWKPSALALQSAALVRELLAEAGLTDLVALVPGDDATGEAVVDAGCDFYVVIGSAATGRTVLTRLGEALRPAVAELSGVDALVVCADADLELAARTAVWARLAGAGQTCMAPRRVFVERAVYEAFLRRAREHVAAVRVGDPLDPLTEMGPVRTPALREAAVSAIEEAALQGARVVFGGLAMPGPGCFLQPALLANCSDRMRVFREDLMAPVMAVCPVERAEEAVARANVQPGSLTASVWCRDRRRGVELARGLQASVVSLNDTLLPAVRPEVPFGGAGESGYGRLRGAAGLRELTRTRVLDEGLPGGWPRWHLFPYRPGTLALLQAEGEWAAAVGLGDRARAAAALWRSVTRFGKEDES